MWAEDSQPKLNIFHTVNQREKNRISETKAGLTQRSILDQESQNANEEKTLTWPTLINFNKKQKEQQNRISVTDLTA